MVTESIEDALKNHAAVVSRLRGQFDQIRHAADRMIECLRAGGTIFWIGNGGSAADSQHMAAELSGRFLRQRKGLASVALTTDTSALTAIGNDFGFNRVFERQVEALCRKGDLLIAISTSGNSENVILAAKMATQIGAFVIGLTGSDGGALSGVVDLELRAPATEIARIQEAHQLVEHILCDLVDRAFADSGS